MKSWKQTLITMLLFLSPQHYALQKIEKIVQIRLTTTTSTTTTLILFVSHVSSFLNQQIHLCLVKFIDSSQLKVHSPFSFAFFIYFLLSPYKVLFEIWNFMLFLVSEVTKGMWAKKQAKMKRSSSESSQKSNQVKERIDKEAERSQPPENNKVNFNQDFGFFFYCLFLRFQIWILLINFFELINLEVNLIMIL